MSSNFPIGTFVRRIHHANTEDIPVGSVGVVTGYYASMPQVRWNHLPADHAANSECNYELNLEPMPFVLVGGGAGGQGHAAQGEAVPTKPSNPKDRAATHRVDMTVFPETASVFGALAMTEGDCKYGGYNYRAAGVGVSTYISALRRHIGKYYDRGEWADPKTNVPHLANALACIAVLIDGHCKGNITDDRPPRMEADLYAWAERVTTHLHTIFPEGPGRFTEAKDGNNDGSLPDWLTEKS